MAVDQFAWWRRALAGEAVEYHDSQVEPGYYRKRAWSEGELHDVWLPVGIYRNSAGAIVCKVDGKVVEHEKVASVFSFACRHPVAYETYKAMVAAEAPDEWPDGALRFPREAKPAEGQLQTDNDAPGIGHNKPPEEPTDPYAAKVAELADLELNAAPLFKAAPTTKEEADRIGNYAGRVGGIASWLRKTHKVEKAPITEAGRALDAKYLRVAERADELAKKLTDIAAIWLRAEQARLDKIAADERAKAEAARRAELEKIADEQGQDAALAEAAKTVSAPPPPPKARVGGQSGRVTTLREVKVAVIVDEAAFLEWCVQQKRSELRNALQLIADKFTSVEGQAPPPGVRIEKEQAARR